MASGTSGISFSNQFVFYNEYNSGVSPFWEAIRQREINYGTNIYDNLINKQLNVKNFYLHGAQILERLAQEERRHEELLLQTLDPNFVSDPDEINYVMTFNSIYKNKNEFIKSIKRIQAAISNASNDNYRAPTLFSWYISYFNQELRPVIIRRMEQDLQPFIVNDPQLWDSIIDEAADLAFRHIERAFDENDQIKNEIYGVGTDFTGLADIMRNNVFFRDLLIEKLHIDEVKTYVNDYINKNKKKYRNELKKRRPQLKRKKIEEAEGVFGRERNLQGYLYEIVGAKIAEALQNSNHNDIKVEAFGIKSDIGATDVFSFLSTDLDFDWSNISDSYLSALSGPSQKEISNNIQEFLKYGGGAEFDKFQNLFIINTSSKLYSMSHSHPFSKTANIQDLEKVLETNFQDGAPYLYDLAPMFSREKDIHNIVSLFYNTVKGAFLDSEKKPVSDYIKKFFVVAAGSLLFSDYIMVGQSNQDSPNTIHLFNLNEVYIPLSVILNGLSIAFKNQRVDGNGYLTINYLRNGKNGILFPKDDNEEDRYDGIEVADAFDLQRKKIIADSKFTIHFANNFKRIINEIAERL